MAVQDVDKLKKALVVAIELAEGVDEALEDGQFSLSEGIAIAVGTIPGGASLWENRVEIVEEIKDLDSAELAEINAYVAAELDLANDLTEKKVEKVIAALIAVVDMVAALREQDEVE